MDTQQQFREILIEPAENHGSALALAKAAGVPRSSLHDFLSGARSDISWSNAAKLLDYLGCRFTKPKRKKVEKPRRGRPPKPKDPG